MCSECHRSAPGTIRQQIQTNSRHLIGLENGRADFGTIAVSSSDCSDCHRRSDDRHPIYRFLEPRFTSARAAIQPQSCLSCHREHAGRRVTMENGFCRHCHGELSIPDDRTRPTHDVMVSADAWNECLRCHDFHGNHEGEPPVELIGAAGRDAVERYLAGGPSPFLGKRLHQAATRRTR